MLVVDDVLSLPGKIGEIIFNSVIQTANKTAWTEYSNKLKKLLLQAKYDLEKRKITQEQYKEIESYVFKEMRIANKVLKDEEAAKTVPANMAVWLEYLDKLETTFKKIKKDYKSEELSKEEFEPLEKHFTEEIKYTKELLDKAAKK